MCNCATAPKNSECKSFGWGLFLYIGAATVLLLHVTDDCQNIAHFNQLTRPPCVIIHCTLMYIVHCTMYTLPDSYLVHLADPR